jgi:nitroreductase
MDFFEVIRTQRAMRRLTDEPVTDDELWKLLDAAIRAPSGGNRQPWNFLVIRDAAAKKKIGEWYLDGWEKMYGPVRDAGVGDNPSFARTMRSADYLARHIGEAPVLILATIRKDMPTTANPTLGASIYPAVQNLMLAARAMGLGTTLTTLHKLHEQEVKDLLGIPAEYETMALIPVGRPKGKFGEADRLPVEKVTYWDRWGERRGR